MSMKAKRAIITAGAGSALAMLLLSGCSQTEPTRLAYVCRNEFSAGNYVSAAVVTKGEVIRGSASHACWDQFGQRVE